MNARINFQTIMEDGKPAYVVIKYQEFMRAFRQKDFLGGIPHEVVQAHLLEGKSLLRAWREYLKLSQKEVAEAAGITQPALAQMEKPKARLRKDTLKKLAKAMNLSLDQLRG